MSVRGRCTRDDYFPISSNNKDISKECFGTSPPLSFDQFAREQPGSSVKLRTGYLQQRCVNPLLAFL